MNFGARKLRKPQVGTPDWDGQAPWPFPDDTDYFLSGSNKPSELHAIAERGLNPGISMADVAEETVTWICRELPRIMGVGKLFVDSGAFSEVSAESLKAGKPAWPKPISDAKWRERLAGYKRIAKALGAQALLVLPDKVASQEGTLERLDRYGDEIAEIMGQEAEWPGRYGPHAILPMQMGPRDLADFFADALAVLRAHKVPHMERLRPGLPLKKSPLTNDTIAKFIHRVRLPEWKFPSIHLLGRGIFSPSYRDTLGVVVKALAASDNLPIISSDSVRIRALVGSRNSPGPYMAAQDVLRRLGVKATYERERQAIHMVLDAEFDSMLIEAIHAGWYDAEVYGSAEEALAALQQEDDE